MREVVFVDGVRTAFDRRGGALKTILPVDLGGLAVKGLLEKHRFWKRPRWTA